MKYKIDEISSEQIKFCNQAKLIKCNVHKQGLTSFNNSLKINLIDKILFEDCPKKNINVQSFKEAEDQIVNKWNKNVQKFNNFICELNLEQNIICLKRNLKCFETQIKAIINTQFNKLNQILQEIEKQTLNKIQQVYENMECYDQVQQLKKQNNDITRNDLFKIQKYINSESEINMQQSYFERINEIVLKFEKNLHPFVQKEVKNISQPILGIAISQDQNFISLVTHKDPKIFGFKQEPIKFVLQLYQGGFKAINEKLLKNFSNEEIQSYQMKFSSNNQYIAVHQMISLKCFDINLKKVFTIEMTKLSQFVFSCNSKYMIVMFQEEQKETSSLRIIEIKKQPNIKQIDLNGVSSDISLNKTKGTLAVLINKSFIKIFQQNMDQLTLLNTCNVNQSLLKMEFDFNCNHLISINSQSIFLWDSNQLEQPQAQPLKEIKLSNMVKITEEQIKESCFINSDKRFFYISVPKTLKKHQIIIIGQEGVNSFYFLQSQLDLKKYLECQKDTITQERLSHLSCNTQFFNAQPYCLMNSNQLLVVEDQKLATYSLKKYIPKHL